MAPAISQLKFHRHFGGGEVYARFLSESFSKLNLQNIIFTHPKARYWKHLSLPHNTTKINTATIDEVISNLPHGIPLITHAPLPPDDAIKVAKNNPLICIIHMPFTGQASDFYGYERVLGVSAYVNKSLRRKGVTPWHEPLLGIADIDRSSNITPTAICRHSEFDWDNKKVRDRLLGWTEPVWSVFRHKQCYIKPDDKFTIGIISRISPIKQLPKLFSLLAPTLQSFPQVNIEFFGAGGYAQVRDLRKAILPIRDRVRFWGHQYDVRSVYSNVDIVLSGLPEREALGLNLIEAQQLDTPVIAVDAEPFTETVANGITGWLYTDPRKDNGASFRYLLTNIVNGKLTLDPSNRNKHLNKFSMHSFSKRLHNAIQDYL